MSMFFRRGKNGRTVALRPFLSLRRARDSPTPNTASGRKIVPRTRRTQTQNSNLKHHV